MGRSSCATSRTDPEPRRRATQPNSSPPTFPKNISLKPPGVHRTMNSGRPEFGELRTPGARSSENYELWALGVQRTTNSDADGV
eukprot:13848522-Alexandrium_andersonii.AAC.1